MFVTGHNGDDVNEYKLTIGFDISTATFVDSFDTESEDNDSRDVKFNQNGTKMFVLGKQNDRVCEYTLSTGFDVSSTVTFVDCASVSEESKPDELELNGENSSGKHVLFSDFYKQMKYVSEKYNLVTMLEIADHISGKKIDNDSVAVTFDDGFKI